MAYWKYIRWDTYRLVADGVTTDFRDYEALHRFCRKRGIDAAQV